jgi:uncharacterized phage protein (TIGR01671 family)
MQYTGLKDRNGKDIYEVDIIVCRSMHDSNVFDGVWSASGPIPQVVKFCSAPYAAVIPSDSIYKPGYWEVIGNIHENPELLK